jgi:7,8-dihydropterin-6-yl-methyl-4-(beta-D-ribofuranosyl)aminobenzene 5'-phosphate synthase
MQITEYIKIPKGDYLMKVVITILVENTTPSPALIGEYGFSALIEVDDYRILFDTGSAQALYYNATQLGIDLTRVDALVISHGHFDHTGGLLSYLKQYGPRPIYAHSGMFASRPLPLGGNNYKDIGCGFSQDELLKAGAELHLRDEFSSIIPGVYISGTVPRNNNFEDTGGKFKEVVNGKMQDDPLADDSALIIEHPEGLIIVSGCAHAGIINIIEHACHQTGKSKVLAFIGGTHLISASPQRIEQTISALDSFSISKIIVSHCTGFYAAARLYNALGECVIKGETGMRFEF